MGIGSRIAAARLARDWSQRELARRAQISYTHVQALERDEMSPTLRTLERLAEALGVQVAALIGSESVAQRPADLLRDWLLSAPEEKREFVLRAAQMAGFLARDEALAPAG